MLCKFECTDKVTYLRTSNILAKEIYYLANKLNEITRGLIMEVNMKNHTEIIKKAYSIVKSENIFVSCTINTQMSFFNGLSEDDYTKLDYKLKAIRQDFAKILVIMNSINKTYSAYQQGKYDQTYFSVTNNQATNELGVFIEYLFIKYRVILEYVQEILEIILTRQFSEDEQKAHGNIIDKVKNDKRQEYKVFVNYLNFLKKHFPEQTNYLFDNNISLFKEIIDKRNMIVHNGSTCLVYGDKQGLKFGVLPLNECGSDEPAECKKYENYWSVQISHLIVFIYTLFGALNETGEMKDEAKRQLEYLSIHRRNKLVAGNVELADKQDVIENMLKSVIEVEKFS